MMIVMRLFCRQNVCYQRFENNKSQYHDDGKGWEDQIYGCVWVGFHEVLHHLQNEWP